MARGPLGVSPGPGYMATFKELNLKNAELQSDNEQLAVYCSALLNLLSEVNEVATVCLDKGFLMYRNGLKSIKAMTKVAQQQNAEARQRIPGDGNNPKGTGPIPFPET